MITVKLYSQQLTVNVNIEILLRYIIMHDKCCKVVQSGVQEFTMTLNIHILLY